MVLLPDPKREPRSFRLARTVPMGVKRGRGRNSFIDSVVDAVDDFYGEAVQQLKTWRPAPPRMRSEPVAPDEVSPIDSTALSSQDDAKRTA